jgi:hypothetical protein
VAHLRLEASGGHGVDHERPGLWMNAVVDQNQERGNRAAAQTRAARASRENPAVARRAKDPLASCGLEDRGGGRGGRVQRALRDSAARMRSRAEARKVRPEASAAPAPFPRSVSRTLSLAVPPHESLWLVTPARKS